MRKPRILWANFYCLLDTSSGASMSVRQILRQLHKRGIEIKILGATVFDAENGTKLYRDVEEQVKDKAFFRAEDGELVHELMVTNSIKRNAMTTHEMNRWYGYYEKALDTFKPDLVFFYGGNVPDFLIAQEAKIRQIPVVAYLANGNYHGTRWCQDVDLIVTDSNATAEMYYQRSGYTPVPCGKFIDASQVVAKQQQRKNILFVNPKIEKGALIVAQIAVKLAEVRPDIVIEVVESRGKWEQVVHAVRPHFGEQVDDLPNVKITPTTQDMRPVYARTKLVLHPSVWWESSSRVLAESMLNGIPAITTDHGGAPEMIGDGGIKIQLPEVCYQKPYNELPGQQLIDAIVARIIALYDDEELYQQYSDKAQQVGEKTHSIEHSTDRLMTAIQPLLDKQAGDSDFTDMQMQAHKHGDKLLTAQ
jgi:glycosyltransferase involved in cell wall biosynthesis